MMLVYVLEVLNNPSVILDKISTDEIDQLRLHVEVASAMNVASKLC